MKVRIVSDLHIDVNNDVKFGFIKNLSDTDLLIIAGDISNDFEKEESFLKGLKSKIPVVAIAGNHLGYAFNKFHNYRMMCGEVGLTEYGTRNYSLAQLKKLKDPIHYLENNYFIYKNYLIFGGTMFTNFELYGNPDFHKQYGSMYLNDFRLVHIYDTEIDQIRKVNTEDYVKWFNLFISKLDGALKVAEEQDLDVIVVSHFAPSLKSVSDKYYSGANALLNPTYTSDLDNYILENKRIKCWVHGHMHDCFDYYIGQCRVVCEPYGYYGEEQKITPSEYYGKVIEV